MNIILGICGSISAYKAYELTREYFKAGINLKVILTKGASEFVHENILSSLGAEEVYAYDSDFRHKAQNSILHIDLVRWMYKLIIAPASANTIAKMAAGISDDLLTSVFLANNTKATHIYPAMNTKMIENKITQFNFDRLTQLSYLRLHKTAEGLLACNDVGAGKLPSVEYIFNSSVSSSLISNNKLVTITTGATVAPLDTVRYLTNPSSGTTGIELAKEFLSRGYEVNLICGYGMEDKVLGLKELHNLSIFEASTNEKMHEIAQSLFTQSQVYISAAAICDIKFETKSYKIKKSSMTGSLDFQSDVDILKNLSYKKEHQFIVGFAAESELVEEKLIAKKNAKKIDLLVANIVNNGAMDELQGFKKNQNEYCLIGNETLRKNLSKKELAKYIADQVEIK